MRASSSVAFASLLLTLTAAVTSRADEEPWITIEPSSRCTIDAAELRARVTEKLIDQRASDLTAQVNVELAGAGYRVTLAIARRGASVGSSEIVAPSCDEALDAAVLALALALGERNDEPGRERTVQPHAAPRAEPVVTRWPSALPAPEADLSPPGGAREALERGWRLSVMTGLDSGTLSDETAYAAVGAARVSGALEVRATVRYGLPAIEEAEGPSGTERERREFGALDLGACYGAGAPFRVSACGGGELGLVRHVRALQTPAVDSDEELVSPRVSGVVRAVFTHRAGLIQPELELSGLAVALGRQDDARWLALRVAAGAAVQF